MGKSSTPSGLSLTKLAESGQTPTGPLAVNNHLPFAIIQIDLPQDMSNRHKPPKEFEIRFSPSGVLSLLPTSLEPRNDVNLGEAPIGQLESVDECDILSACSATTSAVSPSALAPSPAFLAFPDSALTPIPSSAGEIGDANQGLQDDILIALRQIMRAIDLKSRSLLQEFGLTGPQLVCLNTIAQRQPISTGSLAKAVHLAHPTVTGIVNRLEQRGWIARMRSDADRRNIELRLTESGKTVVERAPPPLPKKFESELSKLELWERTQILATLQRIACMLDATEIDLAPLLAAESNIVDLG